VGKDGYTCTPVKLNKPLALFLCELQAYGLRLEDGNSVVDLERPFVPNLLQGGVVVQLEVGSKCVNCHGCGDETRLVHPVSRGRYPGDF
jgi:hypothetical protein